MAGLVSYNIAAKIKEERVKVNVDLTTSGVAYKERMNLLVVPQEVEMQQPEDLREYFRQRLQYYRNEALKFHRGTDPVYHKEEGK